MIESIKMRFKNRKNYPDDLTIDLTPLLDVSFIILIFFILTTTFIEEKRLAIEKPKSNSEQTGQNAEIKIAIDKNNSLYIPEGFAHGFLTISQYAEVNYKTTNYWNKNYEESLLWNDSDISINWPLESLKNETLKISDKDKNAKTFKSFKRT